MEQIAARLDDRFRLLTGGSRTSVARHQTLRATIDWSYDLLTEPERAVLRRLSVFAAGAPLEAAEAVCSGDPVDSLDTLDLLGRLVEKSLVLTDPRSTEARFRLLETVRDYARSRLVKAGEARRHVAPPPGLVPRARRRGFADVLPRAGAGRMAAPPRS